MINWTVLLQHYGYFTLIVGSFFEGETVLILGAYAIQQHVLNFWLVVASAMIGSFIGDQFYYQIGRRYGYDFINRRPKLTKKFLKASSLIDRYPTLCILLMRFAWGLRTAIPISFGIKKYSLLRYILVNVLACFIWAYSVVTIGIQVTNWLHKFMQNLINDDEYIITLISAGIICVLVVRIIYKGFSHVRKKK